MRRRYQLMRVLCADDQVLAVEDYSGHVYDDTNQLADLMFDAYRGTIDDEGETEEDAVAAVESLFAGEFGTFDRAASVVFCEDGTPLAATLVTRFDGHPLIAFSMTRPRAARRGFARRGLRHAIGQLARSGDLDVRLVVTEGNRAAEALYDSEGFTTSTRDFGP